MDREQKIAFITKQCVETNPSIKDKEVCACGHELTYNVGFHRPVRLADVFLAWREWWRTHALQTHHLSADEVGDEDALDEVMWESDDAEAEEKQIAHFWDFRKDDLTQQSDMCLDVLAGMFKPEKV